METRTKLIVWAVLFVAGFLLGFVPQYVKKGEVEAELRRAQEVLDNAKQTIEGLQFSAKLAETRDLAAMMYVETVRQNYGVATEFSTRYFNLLREATDLSRDPEQKAALEELLASRDSIISILARGDAAAVPEIRDLLLRTHTVTKTGQPETAPSR